MSCKSTLQVGKTFQHTDQNNFIRREINYFQTWAGSIRTTKQPVFFPLKFVKELVAEIKSQNDSSIVERS